MFCRLFAALALTLACYTGDTVYGRLLYAAGLLLVAAAEESRSATKGDTAFSMAELPEMFGAHFVFSMVLLPGMYGLLTRCGLTSGIVLVSLLFFGALVLPTAVIELFAWLDRRFDLSPANLLRLSFRALRFVVLWSVRAVCLSAVAFARGVKGFVLSFGEVLKASRPTDDEDDDEAVVDGVSGDFDGPKIPADEANETDTEKQNEQL